MAGSLHICKLLAIIFAGAALALPSPNSPTKGKLTELRISHSNTEQPELQSEDSSDTPQIIIKDHNTTCLLLTINITVTVSYNAEDEVKQAVVKVPFDADKVQGACSGANITTQDGKIYQGPAVVSTWPAKNSTKNNIVAILFKIHESSTMISRFEAQMPLADKGTFPHADNPNKSALVQVDIDDSAYAVDEGKSRLCELQNEYRGNGGLVRFSFAHFEVGSNLTSTFSEATTCSTSNTKYIVLGSFVGINCAGSLSYLIRRYNRSKDEEN